LPKPELNVITEPTFDLRQPGCRAAQTHPGEAGVTARRMWLHSGRVQVSLWPGKNHKRLPSDELQLIIFTSFQWAPLSPWAYIYVWYAQMCVWNVSFSPIFFFCIFFLLWVRFTFFFSVFVLNCCVNQANQLRGQSL